MRTSLILTVDLAWLAIVPLLVRASGLCRGVLFGVFGGFLLLPRTDQILPVGPWSIVVSKLAFAGLAPLLGVLLFDRRTLFRMRPDWRDLPIAAFVLWPLITMEINGYDNKILSIYQSWWIFAVWAIPYLLGRLYFGTALGTRAIAVALVTAGLVYVPICVFETIMGPRWYLHGLIYGVPAWSNTARLGGWRPEGFLSIGMELAAWMALAAVVACWFWVCRAGRPLQHLPGWLPPSILLLTALSCRGVYGYIILGSGLLATFLTQWLRTRLVLVALLLIAPVYIGLRTSGTWNGRELEKIAQSMGRSGTVKVRLDLEDVQIEHARNHAQTLFFGDRANVWLDSWWAVYLRNDGLIGLALFLASFFLIPTGLMLAHFPGQSVRASPIAPAWGLALFLILHMIDSIHNTSYLPPTTFIAGALTGLVIAEPKRRDADRTAQRRTPTRRSHATSETVRMVLILVLWGVLELIGHLPRTPHP